MPTQDSTLTPGVIATHRDWTIKRTGDGIICLNPNGSHCLPGGCTHDSVKDAKRSIDFYILAKGDAHKFLLLHGLSGVYPLASASGAVSPGGSNYKFHMGKKGTDGFTEYSHGVEVDGETGAVLIKSDAALYLSPESALALSNLLRKAAIQGLTVRNREGK